MITAIAFHHESLPEILERAFLSPEMLRLGNVGMHCGCEYTSFPIFKNLNPYSRLTHSYGVASIVYHFTGDIKMALAGAFHDIATPCFSHVIDFLHQDFLKQESTEKGTREIIENSKYIRDLLTFCDISVDEVADYHLYPIADNDSPKLSSDRLEYTLSNIVNFSFAGPQTVQSIYDDLVVGLNEYGEQEIMFRHLEKAKLFGMLCLKTSGVYVCDEDRFSMMRLSLLIKHAIEQGWMREEDLYLDEPTLLEQLSAHDEFNSLWESYREQSDVRRVNEPTPGYLRIPAKLRYIDPFVDGVGRLSNLDDTFRIALQNFLSMDFKEYLGPSSFFNE